ncbi:hypothetical protein AMTRI_Chr08g165190 [Amborella trichopoda]
MCGNYGLSINWLILLRHLFSFGFSIHQSDLDDEDNNVKHLDHYAILYLALQDCLVNTNRNWKSCQPEVQALKACHERKKRVPKENSSAFDGCF